MARSASSHDSGGTISIVGTSTTVAPRSRSSFENSPACPGARVTSTVLPVRHPRGTSTDGGQPRPYSACAAVMRGGM